jgi:hypothetical protein
MTKVRSSSLRQPRRVFLQILSNLLKPDGRWEETPAGARSYGASLLFIWSQLQQFDLYCALGLVLLRDTNPYDPKNRCCGLELARMRCAC